MALQMLHKPMQKVPNFAEPPRQQQPISIPPMAGPGFAGSSRSFAPPPIAAARQDRPPAGYPDMDVPPPSTYDMFRGGREEPPPRFGAGGRDPRSRDPRADRGPPPPSREMMDGPPMGRSSQQGPTAQMSQHLSGADPARRQLLMQVLQLPDDQIAMLPPDQRASILELKKQINSFPK